MFYLFFAHLGIGLLASLLLLPFKKLGRGFFRFVALLALAFLIVAVASRWGRPLPAAMWCCLGLATAYVASLRLRPRAVPSTLLGLASLAGLLAIVSEASTLGAQAPQSEALLAANFLASATLLGAVLLAMILGHWYLVIPGLSFGLLRRMTLVLGGAVLLRAAATTWSVAASWGLWSRAWQEDLTAFFLQNGFFLVLRLVFGLLGPAALLYPIWECVRIRSNTSATGILYVATAIVLIGEIAASWFLSASGWLL